MPNLPEDVRVPSKVAEASRLCAKQQTSRNGSDFSFSFFDPGETVAYLSGTLPHWRQDGTTYFVTFRLSDSLPQEKLSQWQREREAWLRANPEPHSEAVRRDYFDQFPRRIQHWLDAGSGSCLLAFPHAKKVVENAIQHFDGQRYRLQEFVVAGNHVHVLVTPLGEHELSEILHSWKSFTAHELLKLIRQDHVLQQCFVQPQIWQKEAFDHIVRSVDSLEKFRSYIRAHRL